MYKLTEEQKVPITETWLGRGGLQLIRVFMNSEQGTYKTLRGLFLHSVRILNHTIIKFY